jgi:hypothetical protein
MATPAPTLHLPVDLYSGDQLSAVILELRTYIDTLRDEAARIKMGHTSSEPPHVSALLLGVFHGSGLRTGNRAAAEKLVSALEAVRKAAPAIRIMLPALPTRTLKRQLTVWFRAEIHPYALLTFSMRSDLCGGVVVQAGSHIYDFSFREPLINNRQRIAELAANV